MKVYCQEPLRPLFVETTRIEVNMDGTSHIIFMSAAYEVLQVFFFFLYGAAAHIGPWPPLYEVS
jgi:hypothetical protein